MEKLKKFDLAQGQIISNKTQSMEKIIAQGNYTNLQDDLKMIKDEQINLSSFRGGCFEELITRINKRCILDKDLEVMQTKIETQQHREMLGLTETDSKELYAEISELRNTTNDLERAWDMVRINSKGNNEEIENLTEVHQALVPRLNELEASVTNLNQIKVDFETKLQQIVELQNLLEVTEREIAEKISSLDEETNRKNILLEEAEKIEAIKNKVLNMQKEIEKLQTDILNLENEGENPYETSPEYEEGLRELSNMQKTVNELSDKSLAISSELYARQQAYKLQTKRQTVMRLKAMLFHYPEYALHI